MTRHYRRKRYYSTAQRILVHLSTEGLRPEEATQEGVAAAILSGRPTATKWLARLEDRGQIVRERVRVAAHPLPKLAYRLTKKGWREAAALRARLSSDVVTVKAPKLGTLSARMSEVPRLASSRIDLTKAVALVKEGRLDLARLPRSLSKRKGPLVWGRGLRQVDRLFGREEELQALDAWYASASRILLVTGLPGIGKSTLVAGWIQRRPPGVPVYGFELHPTTTAASLLSDFGGFLSALGKPSLSSHLSQGVPLHLVFVRRLLNRDLAGFPILVVLDNADQMSRDVVRLIRGTLFDLLRNHPVKLILAGRKSPRWLAAVRRSVPSIEVLRVSGLDSQASAALLRHRGLIANEPRVQEIIRSTRGHPLLLHLALSGEPGRAFAVQRYLEEEVWDTLGADLRTTLETASVFRRPVSERVLETAAGVDRRVVKGLTERNLLERTIAGSYLVHDLIRDFVLSRLDSASLRASHERAAKSLLGETEPRDRWEGVYHLLTAGKIEAVATYLDSDGAPLLDSVAAEDVASVVRGLPTDATDPASSCVFSEIMGDSLRIRGHIGPALYQYSHALRLAETRGRDERIPRLLRKMAFLERCRNRYSKALGYVVEADGRSGKQGNPRERAEILREMALAEEALGELRKAADHLGEAVDLATDLVDWSAACRSLLTLGHLEAQRGHRERGLDYCLEGLRVAERSGNLTEVARGHIVVGVSLAEMGQLGQSLDHYRKGLDLAQALGNLRLTAYAIMNEGAALTDLGRYVEAGRCIKQAEGHLRILEEADALAMLRIYEGNRERGLGRWERARHAWEEGLAVLRKQGTPIDLVRVLKETGTFLIERGAVGEGRSHLLEAQRIARRLGNESLASEIDRALEGPGDPRISETQA